MAGAEKGTVQVVEADHAGEQVLLSMALAGGAPLPAMQSGLPQVARLVYFDQMAKVATVSIYEAKTRLSHLVDCALRGDEVVITRHGRAVARLVPAVQRRSPRKLGALRGKIRVAKDFDAPLPADTLALFEGRRR